MDIEFLQPLLTILKAHEFPPTTLRFNPTSNLLVSGSPDNTVRVVTIPISLGKQRTSSAIALSKYDSQNVDTYLTARSWVLFSIIFIVFLAVLCQIYGVPDQLKAVIS